MASMLSWSKRSILSVLCVFGLVFLLQCGKTAEDAPGTTGEDDPSADPSTDPDADPGTDPGTDPGNPEHPDPNTMVLPGLDGEESDDLSRIKGSHLRAKFLKPLSEGHYYPPEQLEDLYFNPLEVCTKNFTVAGLVELAEKLGGIKWGYRIDYYENFLTPQFDLYGYPAMMAPGAMEDSANMASSPGDAAPVIQRADLIGSMGTKVFYLSKRNGLFFVDTARLADGSAAISCPLLVPGEPKNFYIQGEHLYLLANAGYGAQNAAVIVFRAGERSVEYVGHHLLEHQTILDSRLFDSTLAVSKGRNA
ncbi:MAG: hypothetical protein A2284_14025 [Deltaproteobacteria bacterium RIFOXYA12_FULL_61_11]|nr:MAG: hypothetical protein A2284_14025 [Deltaproteobacteria bacterium RIFOXYA12_FULL_61_11]